MVGKNYMIFFTMSVDADYDEMEFGIEDDEDDHAYLDEYLSKL